MNGIPFTGSYFYRVHVVFHLPYVNVNRYNPSSKNEEYSASGNNGDEVGFDATSKSPMPIPKPPDTAPEPTPPPTPTPDPPNPTSEPTPPSMLTNPRVPHHMPRRILRMKKKMSIGSNGQYTLALQGAEDHSSAYAEVFLSGEDKDEAPRILRARIKQTGMSIEVNGNTIGPMPVSSTSIIKVELETEDKTSYSLGVNIYAY